jgi:peroxiredoxin
MDEQGMTIYKQSKEVEKLGEKAKADSLMKLAEDVFTKIDVEQKDYIKANPASFVSPYLLSRVYYDMEADVLEGFLNGFDAKLDSVPSVVMLKERVAKLKMVAIGQTAPDFTMNDAEGNPVKLSDIYSKNEYTLVDFWASWCGPCRRENPNVVAVFNSNKSKGFGVFGVSLDTDKEKWLKAIADDQLTWPHVSDLKGWKNEAAALYAVSSIPANLLLDKTGKIVGRNLREEKLGETIAGLLK